MGGIFVYFQEVSELRKKGKREGGGEIVKGDKGKKRARSYFL